MSKFPPYVRERIVNLRKQGLSLKVVKEMLNSEGFPVRYEGVRRLWKRYLEGRQVKTDAFRSGRV